MNLFKLVTLGTVLVCLIGFIGYFIYFVSGVSATYPPIKEYEYDGNINQLITGIKKYVSTNSNTNFEITDTVGSIKYDYTLYMTIKIKNNYGYIEYNLKCKQPNENVVNPKTIVGLVFAYNKTDNTGGYSKDANGISPLLDYFDLKFISPLKHFQNISISAIK